jgi:hypothetical protein
MCLKVLYYSQNKRRIYIFQYGLNRLIFNGDAVLLWGRYLFFNYYCVKPRLQTDRIMMRWLFVGHSPRRSGLDPGPVSVRFLVGHVTTGQVLLWVLWFSPIRIFPLICYTYFLSTRIAYEDKRAKLSKKQWSYGNRGAVARKVLYNLQSVKFNEPKRNSLFRERLDREFCPLSCQSVQGSFQGKGRCIIEMWLCT